MGGAGEHWNGTLFDSLKLTSSWPRHLKEKFGAAHLPENLAVQDWGVTYQDLEPYYWRGEQMMGVSGKAGNIRGQKLEGGNVFEGPPTSEYPLPPQDDLRRMHFKEAVEKLGYSSLSASRGKCQRGVSAIPTGFRAPDAPIAAIVSASAA